MLVRFRLKWFLWQSGAFSISHIADRSLGSHLIGTYDLLTKYDFSEEICVAGALHSVYGTSIFKMNILEPSFAYREKIRKNFGARAEYLAYLFHISNRPIDLESGLLVNRFNREVISDIFEHDIYDLRVIEAANFIDQGGLLVLMKNFPRVYTTWLVSTTHNYHRRVLQSQLMKTSRLQTLMSFNITRSNYRPIDNFIVYVRIFPLIINSFPHNPIGIKYKSSMNRNGFVIGLNVITGMTVPTSNIVSFNESAYAGEHSINIRDTILGFYDLSATPISSVFTVSFTIRHEYLYGMPPAPLNLISNYIRKGFSHPKYPLEIDTFVEMVPLVRLPAPSALQSNAYIERFDVTKHRHTVFSLKTMTSHDPESLTPESPNACRRSLLSTLQTVGWAVVRVDALFDENSVYTSTVADAYHSLTQFMGSISDLNKKKFFHIFDRNRYVGFGCDKGRDWLQLRSGCETLVWPQPDSEKDMTGPSELFTSMPKTFMKCTDMLEKIAVAIWCAVAMELLGMSESLAQELVRDSECEFGSSVHRMFLYKLPASSPATNTSSFASSAHADMGLLTVSPRSTSPALEIVHPYTQEVSAVETFLQADELIVFPGEVLGFLTCGAYRAPIHRVRWTETRSPGSSQSNVRRASMPYFLRPKPSALLSPLPCPKPWDVMGHAGIVPSSMSARQLTESHTVGHRPWRLASGSDY